MSDTYTIYERGVGRLLSFEADDGDEALEEALEAIGLDPVLGAPEIDCVASWLTYVTYGEGDARRHFQLIEEPHGEQPWE